MMRCYMTHCAFLSTWARGPLMDAVDASLSIFRWMSMGQSLIGPLGMICLITNNLGSVVFRDTMMICTSSRTLITPSRL